MVRTFSRIQKLSVALAVILVACAAATPVVSYAQTKPADAQAEKKSPFQIALEAAEQQFVDKKYADALKSFEEILKDTPKAPKKKLNTAQMPEEFRAFLQLRIATCYYFLKKWPEAEKELLLFLDKYPNGVGSLMDPNGNPPDNFRGNAQISLSDIYAKQSKWDEAIVILNKLRRVSPETRRTDQMRAAITLTRVLEAKSAKAGNAAIKKAAEESIEILKPLISSKNFMLPEIKDAGNRLVELYTKAGDVKNAKALQEEMANRSGGTPLDVVNSNFQRYEIATQLFQDAEDSGDPERRKQLYRDALNSYQEMLRSKDIAYLIDKAVEQKRALTEGIKKQFANPNDEQKVKIEAAEAELEAFVKMADDFKKNKDYDALISYHIGLCLRELKRPWESYIAFKDILDNSPEFAAISSAYYYYILTLKDIHRLKEAQEYCHEYLRKFPNGSELSDVALLTGEISFEQEDYDQAVKQFRKVRSEVATLSLQSKEVIDWYIVNSLFSNCEWNEARKAIEAFIAAYPKSDALQIEQMYYMRGLTYFYQGDYQGTKAGFTDYFSKYPEGMFKADAYYRMAVVQFGIKPDKADDEKKNVEEVIKMCKTWLTDYENPTGANAHLVISQRPEVYTLLADVYIRMSDNKQGVKAWNSPEVKSKNLNEAIAYYILAAKNSQNNEQTLDFATKELTKRLPAMGEWAKLLDVYVTLYQWDSTSPKSLGYLYWIIRCSEKLGKTELQKRTAVAKAGVKIPEEFVARGAEEILADAISKNISDIRKDNVEQLITELAVRIVKKNMSALRDANLKTKPTIEDLEKEIVNLLDPKGEGESSFIVAARGYYARAEVDRMLFNVKTLTDEAQSRHAANLATISERYQAEELSPTILGTVGDFLVEKGDKAKAEKYYQYILDHFRSSDFADYGFAGKAELLLGEGKYKEAYDLASEAVENDILLSKEKEIMLVRARSLLALGSEAADGKADGAIIALASRICNSAIPYTESRIADAEKAVENAKGEVAKNEATTKLDLLKKSLESLKANSRDLSGSGSSATKAVSEVFFNTAAQGFNDIAGNRNWRGEATAFSLYSLGQIEEKRGRINEAINFYTRCYLTWKKFGNVTAKAYLRIAILMEQKGDKKGAQETLTLMLDPANSASKTPEATEARKLQATL